MQKKSKRKVYSDQDYDRSFDYNEEPTSRVKHRIVKAYLIDQDEVNRLIAASSAPYPDIPPKEVTLDYPTYTEEEVQALLRADYHPYKSKKKK